MFFQIRKQDDEVVDIFIRVMILLKYFLIYLFIVNKKNRLYFMEFT